MVFRSAFFLAKGLRDFTKQGYERASKRFDNAVTDRSLAGTHCLVTGANQGLGYQITLELAKRGATVHAVCRSAERGAAAVAAIQEASGNANVHLQVIVWGRRRSAAAKNSSAASLPALPSLSSIHPLPCSHRSATSPPSPPSPAWQQSCLPRRRRCTSWCTTLA